MFPDSDASEGPIRIEVEPLTQLFELVTSPKEKRAMHYVPQRVVLCAHYC
jgi:hypothetical protein